jgi:hypothetical protein
MRFGVLRLGEVSSGQVRYGYGWLVIPRNENFVKSLDFSILDCIITV